MRRLPNHSTHLHSKRSLKLHDAQGAVVVIMAEQHLNQEHVATIVVIQFNNQLQAPVQVL
jgi:hypothetical protein